MVGNTIDNDDFAHNPNGQVELIAYHFNDANGKVSLARAPISDLDKYVQYTNLDAIDVTNVSDIPCDYEGFMGVPITFMEKYNPDQFELLGTSTGNLAKQLGVTPNYRGRTDVAYIDENGKPKCPYQRLIIRNKKPEQPLEVNINVNGN